MPSLWMSSVATWSSATARVAAEKAKPETRATVNTTVIKVSILAFMDLKEAILVMAGTPDPGFEVRCALETQRPQNFCWAGGMMQRTFWLADTFAISWLFGVSNAWVTGATWAKPATRVVISATVATEAILVMAFAPGWW